MSGIGRGQVLVVDDDPAIRRSLERGLRLAGFAVTLAGGGRPALAHVRREPTDVVVLDISMPDLDGIQVCRALREDGNDLPVLMLFAFKASPQNTTWDAMLDVWRAADDIEVFESGWTSDHFHPPHASSPPVK
ncbi:response regulator transcription factor [Streptomyces sp. 061-3]|uniref:response regulator transcription factor n=1 Tax=Streptomyces sp. 061-3 TaxID=2789268 RepID=UPI00397FE3FD